ncbi:mitochondrial outer membrane protein porin 4 [Impatiens glandulifera]|uniref:mitochondrial outer membrane protein porin 4 n=1 Tax=Impatiens glandulifera TaxID=253017 RepID=UPI001FB148D1|nr:mitochondrial outer membrane protein porin 4 [Impatiens glandulifera]
MGCGPAPFSEIGKQTKDLLTKDYNFDQKFIFSVPSSSVMGLTATGVKRDHLFVGDLNAQYKSGNTIVDLKFDTFSKISTKVTVDGIFPTTKAALSFSIPDHKSGKLDVQYSHNHATINSSIGLNPNPRLELSTALGNKDIVLGGEIGFETHSASFTKCNAGIGIKRTDFIVSILLEDKGQTVRASYIHHVNQSSGTQVAAEMIHRFSSGLENSFAIGSSHAYDPYTTIKTRFVNDGKVAMLCQKEWRARSLVTVSAEYDPKAKVAPRLGLALAIKP